MQVIVRYWRGGKVGRLSQSPRSSPLVPTAHESSHDHMTHRLDYGEAVSQQQRKSEGDGGRG
jgi:hypothetical protein